MEMGEVETQHEIKACWGKSSFSLEGRILDNKTVLFIQIQCIVKK